MQLTRRNGVLVGVIGLLFLQGADLRADAGLEAGRPFYGRRLAVCVGINSYSEHTQLKSSVNDAAAMATVFEEYGFDEVVLITEAQARRETILNTVRRLGAEAGAEDLFVFYFAGHGVTVRGKNQKLSGYLVPFDCRRGEEARAGIAMSELKALADAMSCRHVLFMTDACHSGYAVAAMTDLRNTAHPQLSGKHLARMKSASSIQILTAGGERDLAFEANGHGLFTNHVLQYLRDNLRKGARGVVSGLTLASHVARKVSSETGGWQRPRFGQMGEGDILLAMGQPGFNASQVALAGIQ